MKEFSDPEEDVLDLCGSKWFTLRHNVKELGDGGAALSRGLLDCLGVVEYAAFLEYCCLFEVSVG